MQQSSNQLLISLKATAARARDGGGQPAQPPLLKLAWSKAETELLPLIGDPLPLSEVSAEGMWDGRREDGGRVSREEDAGKQAPSCASGRHSASLRLARPLHVFEPLEPRVALQRPNCAPDAAVMRIRCKAWSAAACMSSPSLLLPRRRSIMFACAYGPSPVGPKAPTQMVRSGSEGKAAQPRTLQLSPDPGPRPAL